MDTAKVRALLASADFGSISKAAETLGYTQSGVTHMMRSLEEEAGFPLLLRGNRGVKFTAEGERLAPLFGSCSRLQTGSSRKWPLHAAWSEAASRLERIHLYRSTGCRKY